MHCLHFLEETMSCIEVDMIRNRFPDPVPGWKQAHDARTSGQAVPGYCVGGALVLWMSGQVPRQAPRSARFPSPRRLAACLRACNAQLGVLKSLVWAFVITVTNDHGARRPAGAWTALEKSLDSVGAPRHSVPAT